MEIARDSLGCSFYLVTNALWTREGAIDAWMVLSGASGGALLRRLGDGHAVLDISGNTSKEVLSEIAKKQPGF